MNANVAFRNARKISLQILDGVSKFLQSVDGAVSPRLSKDIASVRGKIVALKVDRSALVVDPEFSGNAEGLTGGPAELYVDRRMVQLMEEAFPPGHSFHAANIRRMKYELGGLGRSVKKLRKYLEKGEGDQSDTTPNLES